MVVGISAWKCFGSDFCFWQPADILYTYIAALVLVLKLLILSFCKEASDDQMIGLGGGPGDQVACEGYELVGVAVQERVSVASPFDPHLKLWLN